MKIHHIGYLVKKIEKSIALFQGLGYNMEQETVYDADRDIHICFMRNGEYLVELVSPNSDQSVVYEQLKRIGNAPYHICYVVPDLEAAVEKLREQHYVITQKPACAVAIEGRRVVFLFHAQLGLIELVEENNRRISG